MKSLFRLVFGLAALFGGILWGTLSAAEMNVALTGLEVGFHGCYKDGYLTPVTVRFTAEGGEGETVRVALTSCDPDGTPTCRETTVAVSRGECRADLLFAA